MVSITQYPPPPIGTSKSSKTSSATAFSHKSGSKSAKTMNDSRQLPMPNVTHITNLNQAEATLLHCWTRLSRLAQQSRAGPPSSAVGDERRYFQAWLNQWEVAFTAFLSSTVATMTTDRVTRSRILKANHLACTILASDADPTRSDVFESEFQAIVELAGAVLSSRHQRSPPSDAGSSTSDTPAASPGLDVKEPLYVLMARCRHEAIRNNAERLLARFYGQGAA